MTTPSYGGYGFAPYVSVAQRQAKALKTMEKRRKKGLDVQPIEKISGRAIAKTFWGKQWCEHMESFHDFENRLPRGRRYARNGSVCHLGIEQGRVEALVMGSELYKISVDIETLSKQRWTKMKRACAGRIGSLLELLEGRLSDEIMTIVTDSKSGLFPKPKEIEFGCNCPDWASMCKHVAAVFYGIGVRLDAQPELLFVLRGVDHEELLAVDAGAVGAITSGRKSQQIDDGDLSDIFGVDIAERNDSPVKPAKKAPKKRKPARKKKAKKTKAKKATPASTKKKAAKKKAVKKTKKAVKKAASKTKKKVAKRKSVKKASATTKKTAKKMPRKTVKKTPATPKKKAVKKTKKKTVKRKAVKKRATKSARRS